MANRRAERPSAVRIWAMAARPRTLRRNQCDTSPTMATFATPATLSRRGRIVQYEIIDMSIWSTVSELRPIFITRLVADSG